MLLTQESLLSVLVAEGGRVKKSDLVEKFKDLVDCVDPAEKARNRELFKTLVNNVAFVKEIDGVRYVVVKKTHQHLLESGGNKETPLTGERSEETERSEVAGGQESADRDPDVAGESRENPSELLSPIEVALQRTKYTDIRVRRKMSFGISNLDAAGGSSPRKGGFTAPSATQSKPYALPLRMPPSATRVEVCKLKEDLRDPPESPTVEPSKNKRKPASAETNGGTSSPQMRRPAKSTKALEELKDARIPSMVPLEMLEHEWLVKCASGLWSQVYGLLLRDNLLAEKKDFISGFTVLHWAAKCGNSEILVKVIDISKQGGVDLDINARTHGGYTPLHIAALHNQEYIMAMLVGEYGADVRIRDNCGKKPCHYLHKGSSETLREMLGGGARPQQADDRALQEKDELDLIPDLSKGRHSISRLFQPHVTGHKKKDKQRPGFYSLSNEPVEESKNFRQRTMSDAFT